MQVISLHFKGKMAHFRKYYSNSSSLSFFVPPRTTIAGILAGLIGYERDSYYSDFSVDKCGISVLCNAPVKKISQKMNYLMIKSANDFNGSKENHSQTALELVIPQDVRNGCLDYEVFIHHNNDSIMDELKKIAPVGAPFYCSRGISMALGTAFNLGWIEYEGIFEGKEINNVRASVCSVMCTDRISNMGFKDEGNNYFLIKERMPVEFDNNRSITSGGLKDFLIELSGRSVSVDSESIVKLDDGRNIMWME